jgi:DNA-binding NarL/FixJ family response regulator
VENNLSRIYAKLGVRTRTELARALPRPPEVDEVRDALGG